MSTEFSMLAIMNAALMAQGQEEVLAAGDGTVEWRMLFRNWPLIVESELELGRFRFAREEVFTTSRVEGKYAFSDGYLIPNASLFVRRVTINDACGERVQTDWIQDGSYVYLNEPAGCWIEFVRVAPEFKWSATFSRGIQLHLEALIAGAIKEEHAEKNVLLQRAEDKMSEARSLDEQQTTPERPYQRGRFSRLRRRPVV